MRNKGKKNLWMDYPQKKKITMKYKVFLVIKKICLSRKITVGGSRSTDRLQKYLGTKERKSHFGTY